MTITEKLMEKIAGAAGMLILTELRRCATALETIADIQLQQAGQASRFSVPAVATEGEATGEILRVDSSGEALPPTSDAPDWLRLDLLEQLAREHQVMIVDGADLVALGKARGWLNEAGEFTMLPAAFENG